MCSTCSRSSTSTSRSCPGGAAPRPWSGRCWPATSVTGVCVMRLEEGLDTGGVYAEPNGADRRRDDRGGAAGDAGRCGLDAARRDVEPAARGLDRRLPAAAGRADYAAKFTAADFEIDWSLPVVDIHRLSVSAARGPRSGRSGSRSSPRISSTVGSCRPLVQPEGKPAMSFDAWRNGARSVVDRAVRRPVSGPPSQRGGVPGRAPARSPSTCCAGSSTTARTPTSRWVRRCSAVRAGRTGPQVRHRVGLRHDPHAPGLRRARRPLPDVAARRGRRGRCCGWAPTRSPTPASRPRRRGGDGRAVAEADPRPRQRRAAQGVALSIYDMVWPSDGARLSYPDWIVDTFRDELGDDDADAALARMNEAPPVHAPGRRLRAGRSSQWVASSVGGRAGRAGARHVCRAGRQGHRHAVGGRPGDRR